MSPMFNTRAPGRGVAGIKWPSLFGFSSWSPPQSSWNSIVKELSDRISNGEGYISPGEQDNTRL